MPIEGGRKWIPFSAAMPLFVFTYENFQLRDRSGPPDPPRCH
jgi:hypothetical protein